VTSVPASVNSVLPNPAASVDRDNPWPGLAAFTEEQCAFFHGRDEEIIDLTQLAERRPLVVLFGQSGLGKSSILQAGVFPRLRADGFCPIYLRLDHSPAAPALSGQVKTVVMAETTRVGAWTRPDAIRPEESLWEFFHHRDNRLLDRDGLGVVPVLVLDQFEELFTLGAARGERRDRAVAFMKELAELVENRPPAKLVARLDQSSDEMEAFDFGRTDYRVIISLREDFLPDLESLKTIMPALMQKRMRLARMTGRQALDAVLKPGAGLVDADVAQAIVEFVAGARGGSAERLLELDVEPALLSVICRELNERRRALGQEKITANLVSGNRREILTDFYERSVADLPEGMRTFVEDHLLTKSGFRDNLALETALEFPGVTRDLIDTLVARRLLRLEDRLGVQRVELTHDVLAEVIRASRDQRQQRLALEQAREREHQVHRRLWLARSIAVASLGLLAGVGWIAWFAVRAEREQTRLRASESALRERAQAHELTARQKAYASDMNLLQQALAVDNLGRARDLLDRQRPRPGQSDLRGWEWRYLWQSCLSDAQSIIFQHRNRIGSLAFSADGQWLAAAAMEKGDLSVFNLKTREEIRVPAGNSYLWAAFSPRDSLLAFSFRATGNSGTPEYHLALWNPATRRVVNDITVNRSIGRLAFSGDGEKVITAGNGEIALWSVADLHQLAAFSANYSGGIHIPFAASPHSRIGAYATGSYMSGGELSVVDLASGKELWRAAAAEEGVRSIAFSPDGKILATAGGFRESRIRLWDVESGREVGRLEGHRTFVQAMVFWPDGKTLASASGDQTIRLWDIETRQTLKTLRGHALEVWALALAPDNRMLASGSKDGAVFLWDTSATRPQRAAMTLPKMIQSWRFSDDSNSVITVDEEGRVDRWTGEAFQEKIELATTRKCESAVFARDANVVALTGLDRVIEVWDWAKSTKLCTVAGAEDVAEPLAFVARGGSRLLIARGRGRQNSWSSVEEWDVATGKKTRAWTIPTVRGVVKAALSADQRRAVIAGWNGGYAALEFETGKILAAGELGTREAALSADGRVFAIPNSQGITKIYELTAGQELRTLHGFLQGAHSAAFSADVRRLVIGSGGFEALKIWDMASFEELATLESDGTTSINVVTAFSPNGNVLGSVYGAGKLHLWRAPSWAEIAAAERKAEKTSQ